MLNLADKLVVLILTWLGKLSIGSVYGLARWIGVGFAWLPTEARRVTEININLCFPNESDEFRRRLVRKSLIETVITAFEMGPAWAGDCQQLVKRIKSVEGEHLLQQSLAEGRGVIILAPHLGNWEMIGYYLSPRYDFSVMYQPSPHPRLNALILNSRSQLGATLVPTDKTGVMALFKKLKKTKVIGILPDQKPDRNSGIMAPFFGEPAFTQILGPRLAHQANATAIGAICLRDYAADGYRLYFLPVDPAINDADMTVACSAMNRSVEAWVRMCPEQYQWEYKRFARRPAPLPNVYKK